MHLVETSLHYDLNQTSSKQFRILFDAVVMNKNVSTNDGLKKKSSILRYVEIIFSNVNRSIKINRTTCILCIFTIYYYLSTKAPGHNQPELNDDISVVYLLEGFL